MREHHDPADSGWVGAGPDDDLDARLAAEEAAEVFDRRRPHVRTLLGPIEPAALGVGLVVRGLVSEGATGAGGGAVLPALEDFFAVGGRALVVAATERHDHASLARIAGRAPIHLVAAAGVPAFFGSEGAAADAPPREEGGGVEDAGLLLLDINRRAEGVGAGWEAAFAVGAAAHRRSGLPILLHGGGEGAVSAVAGLAAEGVEPGRIVVLGPAGGWREGELEAVLATGACGVVGVDAAAAVGRGRDGWADRIASLAWDGFGERLLLGVDGSAIAPTVGGAPLLTAVVERFPLRLMEAGVAALAVRRLLVENLARALTVSGAAGEGESDGRG